MFSFFRSQPKPPASFAFLGTDMHSHILPGIDDGAPDVATSLTLIRGLVGMGYTKLIATPHIYQELYPNTPNTINKALQQIQDAVKEEGIPVEIEAAAEYMVDDYFEHLLKSGEPLLTLPDRHILIETSFASPYPNLHKVIFDLNIKGYQPVLAHPERYLFLTESSESFEQIISYGCKLQLNLLSLQGYYGKPAFNAALYMLKKNLVSFVGTDLHHQKHLNGLSDFLNNPNNVKLLNTNYIQNMTWRK